MLQSLSKSVEAFHELYRGTNVLVKAPTEAERHPSCAALIADAQKLVRLGVKITVVFDDSTLASHVENLRGNIDHVIFVTMGDGIKNGRGIAPLVCVDSLPQVAAHSHPQYKASPKLAGELGIIESLTRRVGRTGITSMDGVLAEIEKWRGSGTLCFDPSQCTFSDANGNEKIIFERVYDELMQAGAFRKRDDAEVHKLAAHHSVLRIRTSPLGGLSIMPSEGGWNELSALWSGYFGSSEIGKLLLNCAREAFSETNKPVFALTASPKVANLFEQCGFANKGRVSEVKHSPYSQRPPALSHYNTTHRNPFVLINTR